LKYESALKYESTLKYESALKLDKRFEIRQALENIQCPEIISGANFHFEPVELCILNNNYALCILLRKIPSSDDSAHF
jgi:hypothetical protein